MPVPEKKPVGHCAHKKYKCHAAEAEASCNKKDTPSVSELAAPVRHLDILVHHVRMGQKTLVRLPGKKVGDSGDKGKQCQCEDCQARILEYSGFLFRSQCRKEREACMLLLLPGGLFSCSHYCL